MSNHSQLDACDPRECISSRLLKCNRIISGLFRKHILPFGITNSQLSVLFVLAKRGETSQQVLADTLYLEKSTISRNIVRLMEHGYVVRREIHSILITKKGKDFLEKVVPAWNAAMDEAREILGEEGEGALDLLLYQLTH